MSIIRSGALVATGLALGIGAWSLTAACTPDAAPEPAPVVADLPTYNVGPCATEDSTNCYWDASRMGNGTGTSFVDIAGITYYPR